VRRASNFGVNRSAKQLCCLVPVTLRAPAPGYATRWAPLGTCARPIESDIYFFNLTWNQR
jgi:hypothetical protein